MPAEAPGRVERARGAGPDAQGQARVHQEDTPASAQPERGLSLPQHLRSFNFRFVFPLKFIPPTNPN